jgi:hypothetical protein
LLPEVLIPLFNSWGLLDAMNGISASIVVIVIHSSLSLIHLWVLPLVK